MRVTPPNGEVRTELRLEAPEQLVSGDTVEVYLRRVRCQSDLCSGTSPSSLVDWAWSVDNERIARIADEPTIVARHPYMVRRDVQAGTTTTSRVLNPEESRRLVGRRPGRVWVTATLGDTVLRREVQVLDAPLRARTARNRIDVR